MSSTGRGALRRKNDFYETPFWCVAHAIDIINSEHKKKKPFIVDAGCGAGAILKAFEDGLLPVIVTSRVLNEGVDMPAAEVAVVLSGTGTVREHVQRLGRILRPAKGKQAILYEVVAADTVEMKTSRRRRRHDAYR